MAEPCIKKDAITQMEIKLLETFKICPQEILVFPSVTSVKKITVQQKSPLGT
jgi:hypothetical protein